MSQIQLFLLASTHVVAVGLCVGVVALAVVVRHALVQHVLSILQCETILLSMYAPFSKYSEKPLLIGVLGGLGGRGGGGGGGPRAGW